MDAIMNSIFRLSDCLLATHPDTPRVGTVPEMIDAAVDEIERLRAENERLISAHEKALKTAIDIFSNGPCSNHSGENTPPYTEFIERIKGHCLLCEIDENTKLRAEVERLKAKLGGPDYLLKLDTYEDTVRELMHELAVRDRQAEILDEEWDGRHTVESALAQARAEIAKEAEVKPEVKP